MYHCVPLFREKYLVSFFIVCPSTLFRIFNFIYFYEGKLYNGSDRISRNDEVSKMILSGKKYIPLYVSPIFPSYNALSRPSFNTFYDWFGMAVMIILSLFTFTLPFTFH